MSFDYYAEVRAIIDVLSKDGFTADASALREAIEAGSTANEILMAVRWHLQQFEDGNKPVNLGTKRRIRELIKELNKVLS
jgi:hypothetical protein